MTEFEKEVYYATFNLSRGFFTERPQGGYRESVRGKLGPILFIRGFGSAPSIPDANIKNEMLKANVGGVFTDIPTENKDLDSYIPQLISEIGNFDRKVTLVGYSLGGLIALRYISRYGWGDNIQGLITAASPFNGIDILRHTKRQSGILKDLTPQSEVLKDMRTIRPPPDKAFHLFAGWDEFVGNSSKIDIPGTKMMIPIGGHHNFLSSPEVSTSVMEIVTSFSSYP